MSTATDEVINISLEKKIDLRTAAYINAIKKLDDFHKLSGIIWNWFIDRFNNKIIMIYKIL